MATRCEIYIDGVNYAKIYKHWDGYPEATLQWLVDFNKDFTENRGDDVDYKFAQLLRSSAFDCDKYNLDSSKYTGWGVIPIDRDYGTDYSYYLHKDGTVTYK